MVEILNNKKTHVSNHLFFPVIFYVRRGVTSSFIYFIFCLLVFYLRVIISFVSFLAVQPEVITISDDEEEQAEVPVIEINDSEDEENVAAKKAKVMVRGDTCVICLDHSIQTYGVNGTMSSCHQMHRLTCCRQLIHPLCLLKFKFIQNNYTCPHCRARKIVYIKSYEYINSDNSKEYEFLNPEDFIAYEINELYENLAPLKILARHLEIRTQEALHRMPYE